MEFNKIVEKFKSKHTYLDTGAGKLSHYFGCSIEDIHLAKRIVRDELKSSKPEKKLPKILIVDTELAPMRSFTWGRWKQNVSLSQTISESFLLSWAAKWLYSTEVMSDAVTSKEVIEEDDARIMKSLWELLEEADAVIAHNLNKFDLPKINSRLIINGLPPTSSFHSIDTLAVVKKQFGFSSNKLDALAGYFGIDTKLDTTFELWANCMKGDPSSLKYMEIYNIKDVEILEEVYLKLRPWIKAHPNVALYNDLEESQCTCCGSSKIEELDKLYYTSVGAYKMYRCKDCGGISRGRKTVIAKSKNKKTLTSVGK